MNIIGGLILASIIGGFTYVVSGQVFGLNPSSNTNSDIVPDEFSIVEVEPFCSLVSTPEFVDPGELYRLEWDAHPAGNYTLGGQKVGPEGFIEFRWQEKNVFVTFELRGELDGETCVAYAAVFEKTDEPRCLVAADKELVDHGENFRVSWFGYPETNTVFRVNGTLVDPRDTASYTFPEARDQPIDFLLTGNNAQGQCEHLLTIWPN